MLGMLMLGATGCSTFYDETFSTVLLHDHQILTFDDRLPGAIETVYDDCHDPLVVDPETLITPLGTCSGQPLDPGWTLEEVALATVLASLDDIDVSGAFPQDVEAALTDIFKFSGAFPFPLQNCEVFIELDMQLNGVALTNMDAAWLDVGGVPTLRLSLEQDASISLIEGDIDGDVDCPVALNEPMIQPHLPNGPHTIDLSSVDLTVDLGLQVVGGQVVADTSVQLSLGSLSITPPLSAEVVSRIGDIDTLLASTTELTVADLANSIAAQISAALDPLSDLVASAINDEVLPGYTVDSVTVVGGELVVDSTKPRTKS